MPPSKKNTPKNEPKKITPDEQSQGVIVWLREWLDALVVAYLLAMFIRMFVVELFKIPSPSMTPTLLGTEMPRNAMGYHDVDGDGIDDMFLRSGKYPDEQYNVYLRKGERYRYAGVQVPPGNDHRIWYNKTKELQDRIIVGKFLYWFSPPERGDIVVFKVPETIFDPSKPIYIKRVVGLQNETLSFEPAKGVPSHEDTMGHLVVDGKRVESPEFFRDQLYQYRGIGIDYDDYQEYYDYKPPNNGTALAKLRVPEQSVLVFGDNTVSSQDSRYWGKVDFDRLRGRAIFRYNPRYFPFFKDPGFLK